MKIEESIEAHTLGIFLYLIGEKKTGHKINRVKLLVGGNFSHLHIKLVTFPPTKFWVLGKEKTNEL